MHLTIRDLLSITAIAALGIVLVRESRLHNVEVQALQKEVRDAEVKAMLAKAAESQAIADTNRQLRREHMVHARLNDEIASLKGVVKKSLKDQREWLNVEIANKRIVAISSASSDAVELTDRVISKVEKQTGYDATRFRKLMTPIEALRPTQQ